MSLEQRSKKGGEISKTDPEKQPTRWEQTKESMTEQPGEGRVSKRKQMLLSS